MKEAETINPGEKKGFFFVGKEHPDTLFEATSAIGKVAIKNSQKCERSSFKPIWKSKNFIKL